MPSRRMASESRAYISALLLIAGLAVAGHLFTERAFSDEAGFDHAINVSGRQRMLSQRIALTAGALLYAGDAEARARAREDLEAAAGLFARAHDALAHGDPEMHLPPPPPAAAAIYFEGEWPLDPACRGLVVDVRALLAAPAPTPASPEVQRILGVTRHRLLERLDAVVGAFEAAAQAQGDKMRQARRFLLVFLLVALVAQILLIFRPLAVRLRTKQLAMKAERDWIRGLVDSLSEALLVFDDDLRVQHCNAAAEAAWETTRDQLVGRSMRDLVDAEALTDLTSPAQSTRNTTAHRPDGSTFSIGYRVARLGGGGHGQLALTARDISQQLEYEHQLRVHELGFHSASDAMAVCRPVRPGQAPDRIQLVNAALLEAAGLSWGEVLGMPFVELFADGVPEEAAIRVVRAFEGDAPAHIEVPMRRPDASDFWAELTVVPVRNEHHGSTTEAVCIFRDITERRAQEQDNWQKANVDPVTGLSNRWSFERRVEKIVADADAQPSQAGLLFLDLDGFKAVNDAHGHDAGDELLEEIGARLKAAVRDKDLVARLGGDEFVVVCESVAGVEEARIVAERVLEVVRAPIQLDAAEVRMGASIGVAVHRPDVKSSADWVKAADQAMYAAKSAGKGRVVVAEVSARTPAA